MSTAGIAPLDPTSPIGRVRLEVGDTVSVPLVPPVTGEGAYNQFSDAQIAAWLANGNNSVYRAAGSAIMQLSVIAALSGGTTKSDDMQHTTTGRSADLRLLAREYFDLADAEDAAGNADIFEIVEYRGSRDCGFAPELASRPYVL